MSLAEAAALTDRLGETLAAYARRTPEEAAKPKGFAKLFRRWFTYNPREIEPVHKAFLEETEALVKELVSAVASLSGEERSRGGEKAEEAVALLLAEKPEDLPTDRRLYLIAAEPLCAPLLPLLTREALARRREAMLAVTPRRLLFPRQRELLEEMDRLLAEKDPGSR